MINAPDTDTSPESETAPNVRNLKNAEPRWQALLALIALGCLFAALPSTLIVSGSRWLPLALVLLLLIPTAIAHFRRKHEFGQWVGYVLNSVVTVVMIWSLVLLIIALPEKNIRAEQLLLAAALLWVSKILVCASWYWRLDAGGPHQRDLVPGHNDGAFLFPQMTMSPAAKSAAGENDWSPNFIDYLFLAFNTSTAFSPTDSMVLSRWAKVLIMIQAIISLLIIALLAGRAVSSI
jgi:hypothetical protein